MAQRKSGPAPRPPGYTSRWKKHGKYSIDLKTGRQFRYHPEDDHHFAHWDVYFIGGHKERWPVPPKEEVFKK